MLQENDLRIGTCIIDNKDKFTEAVIVNINKKVTDNIYELLFFTDFGIDYILYVMDFEFCDISHYELNYIPHFYKLDYLYALLKRFEPIKLLGIYNKKDSYDELDNSFHIVYLKTKDMYLQVFIPGKTCIQKFSDYTNPYVYISTYQEIDDFIINKNGNFYGNFFKKNQDVQLLDAKNCDIDIMRYITSYPLKDNIDCLGILFYYGDYYGSYYPTLSICDFDDINIRKKINDGIFTNRTHFLEVDYNDFKKRLIISSS